MMTTTDTPRVWVGCMGCYNAGNLVGEWYDATDAPTDVSEWNSRAWAADGNGVNAPGLRLHTLEAHEELWCFDHEGFHGLLTGECSPSEARELAEVLASVDNPDAFGVYVADHLGVTYARQDWDAAKESFEDAFCGEWESEKDYAQELAEELDAIPEEYSWPASHIDWDGATRDLFMSDYSSSRAPGGGVFVFRTV